jgi:DDE superfamily endonuclease
MEDELECWLKPFLDRLGHKTRQRMCPLYVAGLIGPGDRKSVQPMAERVASGNYDQLHHFIADGVWDATPLETELLNQADGLVGGKDAVLVIDDTHADWPGRSASLDISRFIRLVCSSSDRLPKFEVDLESTTCQIFYRSRPKTCWPAPSGNP